MKITKIGWVILLMGFLTNLLFGGGTTNEVDLPKLIANGAPVIDVRSAGEFAGGHIDGAINIPHHQISEAIGTYETDKNKTIIVYCQSGARSAAAKKSLEKLGYTNIVNGGSLREMRRIVEK